MRTKKTLRNVMQVVAMTSAIALVATGCGGRGAESTTPEGNGNGETTEGESVEASPGITDTEIHFGVTTPLTGPTAGQGNCTVDGAAAYFGLKNDDGGIEFGDGQTRKVVIKSYDDAYDPQKSLANFQQMIADGMFAGGLGLGTPTNLAWREAAIDEEFPQVLIQTGDPIFSDSTESPWQLGLVATYPQEGGAFGSLLAESGEDLKVVILSQNDDFGDGYVEGFKDAVKDASNVEIVEELTYEASDASVDAQMTKLASSDADVIFAAMSIIPLVISGLEKAQQLGWTPSWFLPSNTSSPGAILEPGGADAFPGVYSVAFSEAAASPDFQDSDEGKEFMDALAEYTSQDGIPGFPHCVWSWIAAATMEQAFMKMEEPTRESFMAAIRDVSDFDAPFMLPGASIDTSIDGTPAVSEVVVQKYNGTGFDTVDSFG